MSHDYIETIATNTVRIEAGLEYECTSRGKPKNPKDGKELRQLLAQHPAACWNALKAAGGGSRAAEIQCAADYVLEEWKRSYPRSAGPGPLAALEGLRAGTARVCPPLEHLPFGSWFLKCELALAKDFFSKDEAAFGMTENPIRRSRALRELTIAGSGWKGALRSAFRAVHANGKRVEEFRLFGNEKRADEEEDAAINPQEEDAATRGRLIFCTSYIPANPSNTRLRIINPHARKEKIGKNPIIYEVIREGAECTFQLVYLPWDWMSLTRKGRADQVADDLEALGGALLAMFRDLGAGGKTTSGFGTFSVASGILEFAAGSEPIQSVDALASGFSQAARRFREQVNHGD